MAGYVPATLSKNERYLAMKEIWKDVVGYEGLYQVSNSGKIRSLSEQYYLQEKKPQVNNYGYLTVLLYKNCKQTRKTVHRIVAEAFLPNPNCLPQINHIDENKKNNDVSNLEWCDALYNNQCYARNHPNLNRTGKRSKHKVLQLTLDGEVVKEWKNSRTIFVETEMSDWSISQCCRGIWKTAYGYKWQYAS